MSVNEKSIGARRGTQAAARCSGSSTSFLALDWMAVIMYNHFHGSSEIIEYVYLL